MLSLNVSLLFSKNKLIQNLKLFPEFLSVLTVDRASLVLPFFVGQKREQREINTILKLIINNVSIDITLCMLNITCYHCNCKYYLNPCKSNLIDQQIKPALKNLVENPISILEINIKNKHLQELSSCL